MQTNYEAKYQAKEATLLRDCIIAGSVRETGDIVLVEAGQDICFPVEPNATVVFVRSCYPVIYNHLVGAKFEMDNEIGMILLGLPGVGKVRHVQRDFKRY